MLLYVSIAIVFTVYYQVVIHLLQPYEEMLPKHVKHAIKKQLKFFQKVILIKQNQKSAKAVESLVSKHLFLVNNCSNWRNGCSQPNNIFIRSYEGKEEKKKMLFNCQDLQEMK